MGVAQVKNQSRENKKNSDWRTYDGKKKNDKRRTRCREYMTKRIGEESKERKKKMKDETER